MRAHTNRSRLGVGSAAGMLGNADEREIVGVTGALVAAIGLEVTRLEYWETNRSAKCTFIFF